LLERKLFWVDSGIAFGFYGHSITVVQRSPKPSVWVRILVPVRGQCRRGIWRQKNNINMNKITTYFRESYRELLEKVTWPSWTQLQQSVVIVLVATVLITFIVGIMDFVSSSILHFIYSLFGS
jgi:preprotein translocase subunit SecE